MSFFISGSITQKNKSILALVLEVSIIANKNDLYINDQIRAKEVMVIGPNGEKLGVKTLDDAKTVAEFAGFDLVLINPNSTPPVCKIMDYNKFKYENKKKQKENMKKQRESNLEIKEYRLSVSIDVHDFETRVKNASKYLEKGHRVKLSVKFKGRELAHLSRGKEVLNRFYEAVKDIADIETNPKMEGRFMNMMLMPKKK